MTLLFVLYRNAESLNICDKLFFLCDGHNGNKLSWIVCKFENNAYSQVFVYVIVCTLQCLIDWGKHASY